MDLHPPAYRYIPKISSNPKSATEIRRRCKLSPFLREQEIINVVDDEPAGNSEIKKRKKKTRPKVRCGRCGYATRNTVHMSSHVIDFHLQIKQHKCDQCYASAASKKLLAKHKKRAHSKKETTECKEVRSCQCGYNTTSFAKFRRHFRFNHLQKFAFTCSFCSFVAAKEELLLQHIKHTHQDHNVFICGICGFRSETRGAIKVHTIKKHLTSLNAKKPSSRLASKTD